MMDRNRKLYIRKIRDGMPGYGTESAVKFPWLVFRGDQRSKAKAFSTWNKAMSHVDRSIRGIGR